MAFKPNYQQQRGDRNRAKEQKKQERLKRREEDALKRKSDRPDADSQTPPTVDPAGGTDGAQETEN